MAFFWEDFIDNAKNIKHHALLLLNRQFANNGLSFAQFAEIAKKFCHIDLFYKEVEDWEKAEGHPDIVVIDRERNLLRLEEVSVIRERVLYEPQIGAKRLFFIDNCDRLNLHAANSLLKILEEPNAKSLFIFTSCNEYEVLSTIVSRCQKIHINFNNNIVVNDKLKLEDDDEQWLKVFFNKYSSLNWEPLCNNSLWEKRCSRLSTNLFVEYIDKAQYLVKKYTAEQLQENILKIMVEISTAYVLNNYSNLPQKRQIMSHLISWKKNEIFNISSFFWLTKILLEYSNI